MADLKPKRKRRLILIFAATFVAALVYLGKRTLFPSLQELLAKAYIERRTLELRMARTAYSPVRVSRGVQESRFVNSPALLEAEARISRVLETNPDDVAFLSAKGQANLLEWTHESAITNFQRALILEPRSVELLNDTASAYFERGSSEDNGNDFGLAFELQSRALRIEPENEIVVFNRAITGEHLFLYKNSVNDWKHYLTLDNASAWADEARQRLAKLQETIDSHNSKKDRPLLTASEFVQHVSASEPETWQMVDPRIEEYLSQATTDWLLLAYPASSDITPSEDARHALRILAVILEVKHDDPWLSSLLSHSKSVSFSQALIALRGAVTADAVTEDYSLGRQEARRARSLFLEASNPAGAMRAEFEDVYALHLSDLSTECLSRIEDLSPRITSQHYRWLEIQLLLETYNCAIRQSELDKSSRSVSAAYRAANNFRYPALVLRAIGFLASDKRDRGQVTEAWRLSLDGLRQYWSGYGIPMSAYNLYIVMDSLAEHAQLWHLDTCADAQALAFIPESGNPLMRGVEYTYLAHAAKMADDLALARSSLGIAEKLLASAPQTDTTKTYRLDVEMYLSWLEAQSGNPVSGLQRMAGIEPQLSHISNENLVYNYHLLAGELQDLAGNVQAAESELSTSVSIAEKRRSSLRTEADRFSWTQDSAESYRRLTAAKLNAGSGAQDALVSWELYRGAAVRENGFRSRQTTEVTDLLRLENSYLDQNRLALHDRSVLIYALLPHEIAVWVYDDRGVIVRRIKQDPAYARMLAVRFNQLCSSPTTSLADVQATARALYELLLAPVADHLRPGQALVIEPDDSLSTVPFQALIDAGGNYLEDTHPVVYSPGLRYRTRPEAPASTIRPEMTALVIANSTGEESKSPALADVSSEAGDVAKRFPEAAVFLDSQISTIEVRSELSHRELFHFAGHTVRSGRETGLLLGPTASTEKPQVLTASDLGGVQLSNLKLVVLSACSTAATPGDQSNTFSLAVAFVRAGAQHVVASDWDIDSQSSARFMQVFYGALLNGQSVSRALASAGFVQRRTYPHPYYWASFDTFGDN